MPTTLKIDFVSDVVCPWCAVGLNSLEIALKRLAPDVLPALTFHPFQLNPDMGPAGQDITEHLQQKYGSTPEQQAQMRETIRQRGEAVGFTFAMDKRSRTYNTFDAHRLLHWAEVEGQPGQQLALKKALLQAYFTDGQSPESHDVLTRAAVSAGLDPVRAQAVLASDAYADDVREREQQFLDAGIHSVPAVIINRKHLISGGQPVAVFEQALRQIAASA